MCSHEIYLKRAELLIPTERECFSRNKNVLARTSPFIGTSVSYAPNAASRSNENVFRRNGTFSSGRWSFFIRNGPFHPDDGLFHPERIHPDDGTFSSGRKNLFIRNGLFHPDDGTFSSGTALFHPDDGPFPPDETCNRVLRGVLKELGWQKLPMPLLGRYRLH